MIWFLIGILALFELVLLYLAFAETVEIRAEQRERSPFSDR